VDDALLVSGGEALRDLDRDVHRLADRQRAAGQALAQRLPFQQLGDQVRLAVVGPDVVQREDAGVVQRRDRPRLLLEASQSLRVGDELRRQHLDRHLAPEPRVAGAVHLAHPARTDRGEDLVGAEARARLHWSLFLVEIVPCGESEG